MDSDRVVIYRCRAFVEDAYKQGDGLGIGAAASAIDYGNAHTELRHPRDLDAPSGALGCHQC